MTNTEAVNILIGRFDCEFLPTREDKQTPMKHIRTLTKAQQIGPTTAQVGEEIGGPEVFMAKFAVLGLVAANFVIELFVKPIFE